MVLEKKTIGQLTVLVMVFFLLEYLYLPFENLRNPVVIVFQNFTIPLDSYMYFLCVKVEHLVFAYCIHLLIDAKHVTKWIVISFFLCLLEYPLTYNEPIGRIPMPFDLYVPISTSVLKFASVGYFMYWGLKKIMS
jgi:hypothetical protein